MTAQISDSLSINGKGVNLQGCIALPWDAPHLIEMSEEEALRTCRTAPVGLSFCWRGYVASWEIIDDCLFFTAIDGVYRWDGPFPVFAHWVTGVLRIGQGELLHYVHMGFGSRYEQDLLLDVRQGRLVGHAIRDNAREPFDPIRAGFDNLPSEETVKPGLSNAVPWTLSDLIEDD